MSVGNCLGGRGALCAPWQFFILSHGLKSQSHGRGSPILILEVTFDNIVKRMRSILLLNVEGDWISPSVHWSDNGLIAHVPETPSARVGQNHHAVKPCLILREYQLNRLDDRRMGSDISRCFLIGVQIKHIMDTKDRMGGMDCDDDLGRCLTLR